jgi:hypothetical protein
MRLFLALLLVIPGMLLLASPGLPVGLAMMWGGWWIYERSRISDGDGLITVLMTLGGLGALVVTAQAVWGWIAR